MGKNGDFVLCMRELLNVSFTAHLFTLTLYFKLLSKATIVRKAARKHYVYYFTRTIYLLFLQVEFLQNSTSF